MAISGTISRPNPPRDLSAVPVLATLFIALFLRLFVALWSERIHHPDEIFQYLDTAHRLIYGYGFVTWEYRFGIRNWLLPGMIAGLVETLRILGFDYPTAYVPTLEVFFAALSLSAVYAIYVIGRNVFDEQTGRIAAVYGAVWHELIFYSTIPTPEVLGAYAVLTAFALATDRQRWWAPAIVGLLLGLAVALRLQYAIAGAVIWTLVVIWWGWRSALQVSLAGAAILLFAGMIDALTWGVPFISYYNNVLFNVVYGVSDLFGRSSLLWYVGRMTEASVGLHALAFIFGVLKWKRSWPLVLLISSVVLPHMLVPHKEYRFVFLAIPLLLVLLARASVEIQSWLAQRYSSTWIAIGIISLLSIIGGSRGDILKRDDVLLATLDLSKRNNVAGFLDLTSQWIDTGGFYYFHHNVPYAFRWDVKQLSTDEYKNYFSHILDRGDRPIPAGFRVSARYGSIVLLEQSDPPPSYRKLPADGREPKQPGVDDRYTPNVRRRYPN